MTDLTIPATLTEPAVPKAGDTGKIRDAAQQFEALLIGQILETARQSGGWLGSADSASECATGFAEQQLAAMMARQGGLGLAKLIADGLKGR